MQKQKRPLSERPFFVGAIGAPSAKHGGVGGQPQPSVAINCGPPGGGVSSSKALKGAETVLICPPERGRAPELQRASGADVTGEMTGLDVNEAAFI